MGGGIWNIKKGIKHAKKEGIRLVIALDCGINELVNVAYAKKMGDRFYNLRSPPSWELRYLTQLPF